jgi:hypothetical protein
MTLRLCSGDPIVDVLMDTFKANVIRVPEQRLKPLWIVGRRKGEQAARGALPALLDAPITVPAIADGAMAAVSGHKTKSVNAEVGLKIMEGFLAGFGLGGASPALKAKFEGAMEVSFVFDGVERHYVDTGELGRSLAGRRFDLANPAGAIFSGEDRWDCFLIDSTITSTNFTIQVEKSSSQSFDLKLPEIQGLLGASTGVTASQKSSLGVSFAGPQKLAFAFTAVRVKLGPEGQILSLPPSPKNMFLGAGAGHERLTADKEMLDVALP